MNYLLAFILLSCLAPGSAPQSAPNNESEGPPSVELRLTASRQIFHVGDTPVVIRIELHNLGKDDFIIGNSFVGNVSARAYVLVEVKDEAGRHVILDSIVESGLGISYFAKSWIRVEPSHYYGIEFPLNPDGYRFINVPGKYELTATYFSKGGDTPGSPDWDVPSYPVWRGKLVSNMISLQVAGGDQRRPANQ